MTVLLKQQILQGAHKHSGLLFNLLPVPCIFLGQNYNQKIWGITGLYTPKVSGYFFLYFCRYSTKGTMLKVSNNLLVGSAYVCNLNTKENYNLTFACIYRKYIHSNVSRKYELGSLRKTSTEGIPPIVPGPSCRQLDLCSNTKYHSNVTNTWENWVQIDSLKLQICRTISHIKG